eukprot:TRINITY_DN24778_c0_g1_i1.p1 TRINITY_DN24778_c0_g1~~TRINITY_DN24778_c0_g1_i1.p1  ORF type:complete len:604 (+),score=144.11 TRINITY_DN24778_c0_g1_i1:94-1812(+)
MGAWVMEGGGVEGLRVSTNVSIPVPGKGEVRVKVMAAGLNYQDIRRAKSSTVPLPAAVGLDGAGVIDCIGEGCDRALPVGTKVYFTCDTTKPYGTLAEYTVVPVERVFIMQENVSFTLAASLPTAGWAAYLAVHHRMRVQKGKTIYITGGAGGVGGFATNLSSTAGLTVITSCSAYNTTYAKELGAAHVLDYTSDKVKEEVMAITGGKGVDYVLDVVGTESVNSNIELLAQGGHICTTNGIVNHTDDLFHKGISVHYLNLEGLLTSPHQAQEVKILADTVMHLTSIGQLKPNVGEVGKWQNAREALQTLASRHVQGKLVINIEPLHMERDWQRKLSNAKSYTVTDRESLKAMLKKCNLEASAAAMNMCDKTVKVVQTKDNLVKCSHAGVTCWIPEQAVTEVQGEASPSPTAPSTAADIPTDSEAERPSSAQDFSPRPVPTEAVLEPVVPTAQHTVVDQGQPSVPQPVKEQPQQVIQPPQAPVQQVSPVPAVQPVQVPQPTAERPVQQPVQQYYSVPVPAQHPPSAQAPQAQQPQYQQPPQPSKGGYYIPPQYLKHVEDQKLEEQRRLSQSKY